MMISRFPSMLPHDLDGWWTQGQHTTLPPIVPTLLAGPQPKALLALEAMQKLTRLELELLPSTHPEEIKSYTSTM